MSAITKIVDGVLSELTSDELRVFNEEKAAFDAKAGERTMLAIRTKRDGLLAQSDWMANSDVTISDAWKTYRKTLRNLPASKSDPDDIVWPTAPE